MDPYHAALAQWGALHDALSEGDAVSTCKVGQTAPCGRPATHVIAVAAIADTVWATKERPGGVIPLCDLHATTPVADWREGGA